jgi:hypothetical protein
MFVHKIRGQRISSPLLLFNIRTFCGGFISKPYRIFVSAPKSNSTIYNVLDTGAIYSCRLPVGGRVFGESVSCQEVDVTNGLKSRSRKTTFGSHYVEDTMTRHMFLGSSISLSPDRNDVLACGHLWTNEIRIRGYDSLNPSGRCWIFDAESEKAVNTLLPFTVWGTCCC